MTSNESYRWNETRKLVTAALACMGVVLWATGAMAVPVGSPYPFDPNFDPDSGVEQFMPQSSVVSFELLDIAETVPGAFSAFGFYYVSDPTTTTIIFGGDDIAGSVAGIDFLGGGVTDYGEFGNPQPSQAETGFSVQPGPIGFFYVAAAPQGGTVVAYTETYLTGDDLMGTYQKTGDPLSWLITVEFEGGEAFAIEAVEGIAAVAGVPEPSAALLFVSGALVLSRGTRRLRS